MVYSTKIRIADDVIITIALDPEDEAFMGIYQVGEDTFPIELGGE